MTTTRRSVTRTVAATVSKLTGARTSERGGKVGMRSIGNSAVAQAPDPSANVGDGSNRTNIFTFFTKVPVVGEQPQPLYNGDRLWARVILTLETAGPVVVGQSSSLAPVLSGKGTLLETGMPTPFTIAKGTRLYIAATAINRVKVVIEPLPWLEQITASLFALVGKLTGR